jgi:hypothetical protein
MIAIAVITGLVFGYWMGCLVTRLWIIGAADYSLPIRINGALYTVNHSTWPASEMRPIGWWAVFNRPDYMTYTHTGSDFDEFEMLKHIDTIIRVGSPADIEHLIQTVSNHTKSEKPQ